MKDEKLEELEKEIDLLQRSDRHSENLSQNQQLLKNAIQLMVTKNELNQKGYQVNSAAQLIRELKELVTKEP